MSRVANIFKQKINEFSNNSVEMVYKDEFSASPASCAWSIDRGEGYPYTFIFSLSDGDDGGVQFDFGAILRISPNSYFLWHTLEDWQYENIDKAISEYLNILGIIFTKETQIVYTPKLFLNSYILQYKDGANWIDLCGNRSQLWLNGPWKKIKIWGLNNTFLRALKNGSLVSRLVTIFKKVQVSDWILLIAIICYILISSRNRTVSPSDNPECKMLPCTKGSDGKTIILQRDYYNAMEKNNKRDE